MQYAEQHHIGQKKDTLTDRNRVCPIDFFLDQLLEQMTKDHYTDREGRCNNTRLCNSVPN